MRAILPALVTLAVLCWIDATLAGTFIPVSKSLEFHFEPQRRQLIIPTNVGRIERYDVDSRMLLEPFAVGNTLRGSDIGSDGSYLYVGESVRSNNQSFIHKVNLDDGTYSSIGFDAQFALKGVYDVTIAANDSAYFSRSLAGSGSVLVDAFDLLTESQVEANLAYVSQNAFIARGADRSVVYVLERNVSSAALIRYDTLQKKWHSTSVHGSLGTRAAVSRDGGLIAANQWIFDYDLEVVHELPMTNWAVGGLVFDPLQDLLYVADRLNDSVRIFEPGSLSELGCIPIGQDIGVTYVGEPNHMTISNDGRLLFVQTIDGIRMLDNPFAVPEPTSISLAIMGLLLCPWGRSKKGKIR